MIWYTKLSISFYIRALLFKRYMPGKHLLAMGKGVSGLVMDVVAVMAGITVGE